MDKNSLKKLKTWFLANAAKLPWRLENINLMRDPYAVWISETMLQQTQVSTVYNYYIQWMNRFPNIESLAKASESEVFKYWQGLGYYSRAKNLLKSAKLLYSKNQVALPNNRKELECLPGIGSYTAGAILSLAFHKPEAILDGNLIRIFSRFYLLDFLPDSKKNKDVYWDLAKDLANSSNAHIYNEALMELGRTVCKAKNPSCNLCPLATRCRANLSNCVIDYPRRKSVLQKDWHGMALVIESADGKIFAVTSDQKFLSNQLVIPHFEISRTNTAKLPASAECYVNADDIKTLNHFGSFKHNITVHKIECEVLFIKLKTKAKNSTPIEFKDKSVWVKKEKINAEFANAFSLKALKKCYSSNT